MKQLHIRRGGPLMTAATFALVVLAACGSPGEEAGHEDVTRVPTMSDAAAQATREAPPPGATPEGSEAAAGGEATPADGGESAAAMTVEVVSFDIYFEPGEITIPADTDVTFVLPNQGVTAHNFAIDELGIDIDQAPGSTEEVVINAPAGEYEYYCNVPGHKAAGMVGTLIVSEDAAAAPAGADEGTPSAEEGAATPIAATPVPSADEATPAAEAQAATDGAGAAPPAADQVEVVSFDIYFEPTEVTIPADTDVPFVLPNEGVTLHNFAIDALGIDVDIAPGETQEVVVNAPAGEYEYYCNVPGHKAAGMVGTLIVTDEGGAGAAAPEEETETSAAQEGAATAPAAAPEPAAEAAAEDEVAAAEAEPVEVVSLDILFEPDEVTIPADTDVTFVLPNEGVTAHNFAIDELDISVDQAPGETQEIVINAPAGTYEFYCNVPGHKAAGMVGTLTVE